MPDFLLNPPSFQQIIRIVPLAGALIAAILSVTFCWYLIEYAVTRGDDAKRAHAKDKLLELTIYLWFFMILWWIVTWIGL